MSEQSRSLSHRGFTLVELLVVIGIIAVLAGLVLSSLSKAKARGQSVVCSNNLRQLATAMIMYCDEHEDRFPTSAAKGSIGAQPEDWIWWQLQNDASGHMSMRDPKGSPLAAYLGGFEPRFFRCPLDRDALAREILWKQNMSQEMYTYSYSLNAFSDRGMASFMSADRSRIQFNRLSSVMKPAQKIMLAEEKGSPEDGPGSAVIDDGAWQPLGYPLTMRHAGRANVAFADGHVAVVPREFADLDHPEHFDPAR